MPKVELPTTFRGWVATLLSSVVGFFTGTLALAWLSKKLK